MHESEIVYYKASPCKCTTQIQKDFEEAFPLTGMPCKHGNPYVKVNKNKRRRKK